MRYFAIMELLLLRFNEEYSVITLKKKFALGVCALSLMMTAPLAQAAYKWIGPDGKVTYSDLPPPSEGKLLKAPAGIIVATPEPAGSLPYALKQSVNKYPVTLFSTAECAGCKLAREVLAKRGIPYTEKSIATAADIEQMKKLGFAEATLPSILVGKEKAVGFEAAAYDRLFDAAGYPRTSILPSTYKPGAAEALAKSNKVDAEKLAKNDNKNEKADAEKPEVGKLQAERARLQAAAKTDADNPIKLKF
jgi:glutaredoxin